MKSGINTATYIASVKNKLKLAFVNKEIPIQTTVDLDHCFQEKIAALNPYLMSPTYKKSLLSPYLIESQKNSENYKSIVIIEDENSDVIKSDEELANITNSTGHVPNELSYTPLSHMTSDTIV